MSRQIKFRAWDKQLKKMFDVQSIDTVNEMAHYWSYENRYSAQGYDMPIELMQYIGLKDKNGKEVYEGDILCTYNNNPKYDLWDKEEHGYTQVVWDEQYGFWTGTNWVWEHDEDSVLYLQFVKVIGNIYENPELRGVESCI